MDCFCVADAQNDFSFLFVVEKCLWEAFQSTSLYVFLG